MDQNFDRPLFPRFEAPCVGGLPYMLETCRSGTRPVRWCAKKTKNFGQIQQPRTCRFENCMGGPRPVRLCVEKSKNFGQIQPPQTCRQK